MTEIPNETLKALLMIALFAMLETAMGFQNIRKFRRVLDRALTLSWHAVTAPRRALQLVPRPAQRSQTLSS